MKGIAHQALHRVLSDRRDQPIALGRSLQFVERLVQVECARGSKLGARLGSGAEDFRSARVRLRCLVTIATQGAS
jgi:hypothetical protein